MERQKTFFTLFLIVSVAFGLRWLPTFWAYFNRGEKVFLGVNSILNNEDAQSYLADVLVGKKGHFLLINQFGAGFEKKLFLKLPYVYLGHLARIFNFSPQMMVFLASYFFTLVFALVFFAFSGVFLKKPLWRYLAVSLALMSCPFLVFFEMEASPFLSLCSPHFILAQICLIFIFYAFLKNAFLKGNQAWFFLGGFLSGLGLSLAHFFMTWLVILFLTIGMLVWPRFKNRKNMILILLLLVSALPISFFTLTTIFKTGILKKNIFLKEGNLITPLFLIFNLGPFLFLLPLILKTAKKNNQIGFLILVFFVQSFLGLFFPFEWRKKLFEGWWIWVVLLSTLAFKTLFEKRLFKESAKVALTIFWFLSFSATPILVLTEISWISPENIHLYASKQEAEAWQSLVPFCDFSKVVYANLPRGSYLPPKTGCRSFVGHLAQTPNFDQEFKKLKSIFKGQIEVDKLEDYFQKKGIDFIFVSQKEVQVAKINQLESFKKLFENEEFLIYEKTD